MNHENDITDELVLNTRSIAAEYDRLLNQMFFTLDDLLTMFKLVITPELPYINNGKYSITLPTYSQLNDLKLKYLEYEELRKQGIQTQNPLANPKTVMDLKIILNLARNYYAQKLPGALSTIVLKHTNESNSVAFDMYSPKFFLNWAGNYWNKPPDFGGRIGIITGTQGSGKTNFVLDIDELALKEHIDIISNIQLLQEYPEGYHYVGKSSSLYIKAVQNALMEKPSLGNIDEALLAGISKQEATTVELMDLDKSIRIMRKILFSPIYIMHENRVVASAMLDSTGIMFHKYGSTANQSGRQSAMITRFQGEDRKPTYIHINSISKTSFQYNSRQLANYVDDVSISTIYNDLIQFEEEVHDPKSQFRYMIKLLLEYQEFHTKTNIKAYHRDKKSMDLFRKFQQDLRRKEHLRTPEEVINALEVEKIQI
jgi:hypothetical protein